MFYNSSSLSDTTAKCTENALKQGAAKKGARLGMRVQEFHTTVVLTYTFGGFTEHCQGISHLLIFF